MDGRMLTNGAGDRARENKDFYPTPPEATQALINFCKANNIDLGTVWEPACGDGAMTQVFQDNNIPFIGTDIVTGTDYLTTEKPEGVTSIITNPPFFLSEEFIRKATQEAEVVAMLLKSQYWHSKKRMPLFFDSMPAYVLPLTWRPDFLAHTRKKKGSPTMEVIWTIWIEGNTGTKYIPLSKPVK